MRASSKALIASQEQASDLYAPEKPENGACSSLRKQMPTCGLNAYTAASYRTPRDV